MNRDREKPSWRELDKRKDQSPHRKDDKPSINKFSKARSNSASIVYKAKLDRFFDGEGKAPAQLEEKFAALKTSGDGKVRKAAAKKIIDAITSSARNQAVKEYLDKWELPPDYSLLQEVLACSDDEFVSMALGEIEKLVDANRPPKRKALLEQRLKNIASLCDDDDIVEKAESLLKKIRIF